MSQASRFLRAWASHWTRLRAGGRIEAVLRGLTSLLIALVCFFTVPVWSEGQVSLPLSAQTSESANASTSQVPELSTRWEINLDGQVGLPGGSLRVSETNNPGTHLRLHHDLGIDVSEAAQLGIAYHFDPHNAFRATFLYFFLDGTATVNHPIVYNGQTFPAGRVHTDADFWRLTLAYERVLISVGERGRLIGSAGLTYVYFNPTVNGNNEDFYLQELPVPLLGLRLESPLTARLSLTTSVAGGLLPRVDSLRKEGGTVYLQQSHADVGRGVAYALTRALQIEATYRLTYFTEHELSHEDINSVQLLDNGFRLGLTYRF